MKTYYDILGIKKNASVEEINIAYNKLYSKFYSDKNNGDEFFKEMFQSIKEAYETLSIPTKKTIYDNSLDNYPDENSEKNVFDELIIKVAYQIILQDNASTAFIQTKFSIGYNRAVRITEQLVQLGITSYFPNYKVLVSLEGLKHILLNNLPEKRDEINEFSQKLIDNINKANVSHFKNKPTHKSSVNLIWEPVIIWRRIKWTFLVVDIILALIIFENRSSSLQREEFINIKATTGINMRAEPNSNSTIIVLIPNNEQVKLISNDGPFETISGKNAKWIKVDYNRKTGWIWSGFTDYYK
jgi:curved DNA-binding protein CbpA